MKYHHTKINCPECNKSITKNNLKNHVGSKACQNHKNGTLKKSIKIDQSWKKSNGKFGCPHCDKEYTEKGIATHIWKSHGDGINHKPTLGIKYKNGRTSWNKGLTKETDNRVKKNSDNVSKTFQKQIKDGTYKAGGPMSLEARQRCSERQSLHNSGGKSKWFEVNGIKVQGTYEKHFAEKLTEQKIDWIKPSLTKYVFKYNKDEIEKSYSPDFYIPKMDLYVEIKGYWWGDDENKMRLVGEQHKDKKLVVIFGK